MKFRSKAIVDAVQWFPAGDPRRTEGVEVLCGDPRIHYSMAEDLFYITRGGDRPMGWLSVKKTDGPVPEDQKNRGVLRGEVIQFTIPSTGEVYWREYFRFSFFNVDGERDSAGRQVLNGHAILKSDGRYIDYCVSQGWGGKIDTASIKTPDGTFSLNPGDWVVTDEHGHRRNYTDATFRDKFETAE